MLLTKYQSTLPHPHPPSPHTHILSVQKGDKNEESRVASLNRVPFHLYTFSARSSSIFDIERICVLTGVKFGMAGVAAFGCLVGCFGVNGSLRQYLSLYLAVSQREIEKKRKGRRNKKDPNKPHPHPLQALPLSYY